MFDESSDSLNNLIKEFELININIYNYGIILARGGKFASMIIIF